MGKPVTLLEQLCGHALSFGAHSFETERKDGRQRAFAQIDDARTRAANFEDSSTNAREFRANLYAATKKPFRTAIGGRVYVLHIRLFESFGEDAFEVGIDLAPKLDPSVAPPFTAKQGQYLAFIYNYTMIHGQAPAELDLERYFKVSPPAIHKMIKTLERNGLIEGGRVPGARLWDWASSNFASGACISPNKRLHSYPRPVRSGTYLKGERNQMYNGKLFAASALFALGLSCFPAWGASPDSTFTMAINGSLGRILAGGDPIGGMGKSGVIDVKVSETLSPIAHTATSATYKLPSGSVSSGGKTAGGGPTMMKITKPASGPVTVYFSGNVSVSGFSSHVTATLVFAHGAFPASVLKHPAPFSGTQTLTGATTSGGAGSKVSYTAGGTTVLALSGSATD